MVFLEETLLIKKGKMKQCETIDSKSERGVDDTHRIPRLFLEEKLVEDVGSPVISFDIVS
jgi:hypothetical protein